MPQQNKLSLEDAFGLPPAAGHGKQSLDDAFDQAGQDSQASAKDDVLMQSRRQMSAAEADRNMPQRTVGSAVREGLLGATDTLGLTAPTRFGVLKNAGNAVVNTGKSVAALGKAALTGNAKDLSAMAGSAVQGAVAPAQEAAQGIRESDPDKFMHGFGGIVAVTAPMGKAAVDLGGAIVPSTEGLFSRTPANLLKRVMPNVELDHLTRAGHDLKAAEATTGVKNVDVPSTLSNEEHVAGKLNDRVQQILDPQKNVVVPGSRSKFIDEQMKEIPDDIKLHDPARYQSISNELDAQRQHPDLTIGEINDARVSANKLRRSFYNSKLGVQLGKDEQLNSALLAGRDRAAHSLLDYGVDNVGLGGASEIKNLTQRLGSLIRTREGLQGVANTAELQAGAPRITKVGEAYGRFRQQVRGDTKAFDQSPGVNEDIAKAFGRWKGQPAEFQMSSPAGNTQPGTFVRPTNQPAATPPSRPGAPPTLAGTQAQMLPSHGPGMLAGPEASPKPYQPGMAPMDAVPGRKVWAQGAPKPTPGQSNIPTPSGPLFESDFQPSALPTEMDKQGYQTAQRQRQTWNNAPQRSDVPVGTQRRFDTNMSPDAPQKDTFHPGTTEGKQQQLFSDKQTPYDWSPTVRDTSTTADLQSLAREIETHMQQGGSQKYASDLADVKQEIRRRMVAQGRRF